MPRKTNTRAAQGTGTVRKKKVVRNGKTYEYWEARVTVGRDPGTGKQIQHSFSGKSQKEVTQKMKAALHKIDIGLYTEPNKLTLEQWLNIWVEEYVEPSVKPSTYYAYKTIIATHFVPALGKAKFSDLNSAYIQKFCNNLTRKKGLAPKTAKNIMSVLHKSLEQAVELKYLPFNPTTAVKLPRIEKQEIKPLTEDNIAAFLKEIDKGEEFTTLFKTALFTGMREGEICGLSWDSIDFASGTITVKQQLQKHKEKGGNYYIATTKNGKIRTLTVAPYVMEILKLRRAEQSTEKMLAQKFGIWNNKWDLVFTNADGSHIIPQTVLKHFKRIAEKIDRPDARFHDLRHTYAVTSLQEGDDVKTVQQNLGHATASFTLDVYGHVSEKMKQESAARMENFIKKLNA